MATKAKKPAKPETAPETPAVEGIDYKTRRCELYIGPDALTADFAKKLIGWTEESDTVKFGDVYDLTDARGNKIRFTNNRHNRPFTLAWCKELAQMILNMEYEDNGESFIIGVEGNVLSGQHRLPALILAEQYWSGEGVKDEKEKAKAEHWQQVWGVGPPVIPATIQFGIPETSRVRRTLDNTKKRTFADVLYSDGLFDDKKASDRAKLCRMADFAVKLLWARTGAVKNPYAPRKTNTSAVEFIQNHGRLKDAIKHIFEENSATEGEESSGGKISHYISPGVAAGLMYLMGTSNTDSEVYTSADIRSEESIDFENWDKAEEFWTLFAGSPDFQCVREAIAEHFDPATGKGGSVLTKTCILAKAWADFLDRNEVSEENIELDWMPPNKDGVTLLNKDTLPTFAGIDQGEPRKEEEEEEEGDDPTPVKTSTEPSPEDIAKHKAEIKAENERKLREQHQAREARKNRTPTPSDSRMAPPPIPTTTNGEGESPATPVPTTTVKRKAPGNRGPR